jgi:hypothetical protein
MFAISHILGWPTSIITIDKTMYPIVGIIHGWLLLLNFIPSIHGRINSLQRQEDNDTILVQPESSGIHATRRQQNSNEDEYVPVIIGFNKDSDGILDDIITGLSQLIRQRFKRIDAISAMVTRSELFDLQQNPNILYIEEDVMVYPDSSAEATSYGLRMVQAFTPVIPYLNISSSAACNDPSSFKIGIVDSGLAMYVDRP